VSAPTFVAAIRPAVGWAGQAAPNTKTTASFNVTAGDILVVLGAADDSPNTLGTPSGGSLTWTQQENNGPASQTRAAIWTATASSTASITVSMTAGGSVSSSSVWGFVVHQYRNAAIGAHTSVAGASGTAPSLALTTTADNSAISYISADWNAVNGATRTWRTINSITPTSGNGLETDYFRDAAGAQGTVYGAYWSDVGTAGAKTTGLTVPSTQKPTVAVLEVKGVAAAGIVGKKLIMQRQALVRASYW
jgi:hypothetical protein